MNSGLAAEAGRVTPAGVMTTGRSTGVYQEKEWPTSAALSTLACAGITGPMAFQVPDKVNLSSFLGGWG